MVQQSKDWMTPIVTIGGLALVGFGLYYFSRRPPGVAPSETIIGHLSFGYSGVLSQNVTLQIRFGWYKPWYLPLGFDTEESLGVYALPVTVTEPKSYVYDLKIVIPDGARKGNYDTEGAILFEGQYVIRAYQTSAVKII